MDSNEMDGQDLTMSLDIVPLQAPLMYNPEVLKLVEKLSSILEDVSSTVADAKVINNTIRSGIIVGLDEASKVAKTLKELTTTPINEQGKIESGGIGDMPIIYLEDMSLHPLTKEVEVDDARIKLPRAEFVVLYSLAARCGQEVVLGRDHSLLTRLSTIRRLIPSIKPKIESVGQGKYILHCKYKQNI